jgi:CheY-like chemotaxis protein
VDVAYDGAAALEAVQRGRPELVLLDIGLPVLNGYEVAQRIPEHADTNRPVIVALTGYGQEENRERAKAAGFDLYLVKPVDPLELTKVLAAVANGSDARSLPF